MTFRSSWPPPDGERVGRVEADRLEAEHVQALEQRRIDLAGHDRGAGLHGRKPDLVEARGRPGREKPQVVGDASELDGESPEGGGVVARRRPALEALARVGDRDEGLAGPARRASRSPSPGIRPACSGRSRPRCRRARARSRPSSERSRTARRCSSAAANARNSWPSVTGTASIRCVRPDLTMPSNSAPLRAKRLGERADLRREPAADGERRHVQRGGERVVGGLAEVDVVVRVDGLPVAAGPSRGARRPGRRALR